MDKVDQIDNYGRIALMVACLRRLSEVSLKLIDKMDKVDQVNRLGGIALIYASDNGLSDVYHKLIDKMNKNTKPGWAYQIQQYLKYLCRK